MYFNFIDKKYTANGAANTTVQTGLAWAMSINNVQAYYNIPKGEYLLKAGTPLAQIIPLSEEKFELVVRDKNKSDDLWLKKKRFIMNFTFKIRRNLVQDIYNKHFGGK